jgi:hypothetical protein
MDLSTKSKAFSFSTYDWYGSFRGTGLFILAALVSNIGAVESQLSEWAVSSFVATLVLWAIADLGRRFLRDYSAEK